MRNLKVLSVAWLSLVLVLAGVARAEEPAGGGDGGGKFTGAVFGGYQNVDGEEDSSKLEEYRDLPDDPVLPWFLLSWESADMQRFWNMEGKDVAQGDQRLDIRAGDYGLWNISAYWDRIPHLYSTDSELIYDRVARDEFRLAAADQAYLNGVVGNHTAVQDRFDALSSNFDLDSKETYYGFKVGGRPTPDWDVGASWERQEQDGTKALGGMITFFNINEVPAPMDYTTDQVEAWAEWAKKKGYVSMRFSGSWFNDGLTSVTWDQPFVLEASGQSYQGAYGLPPDNQAWTATLAGGVDLWKGRLQGTFQFGQWTQDEAFLPMTIKDDPNLVVPDMPAGSLDGEIATTLADLYYTARPLARMGFKVYYRYYDNDNNTPRYLFDDIVRTDDALLGEELGTSPVGYTKENAGVDLDFDIVRRVGLRVGFDLETWDRDYREVDQSDEKTIYLELNANPSTKWSLHLRGETARRRYDDYDYVQVYGWLFPGLPLDELEAQVAAGQRKFDEANRDRDRVDLQVQWSPIAELTFGGTYSMVTTDYRDLQYGVLGEDSDAYGVDFTWSPKDRVSVWGNYVREFYKWDERQIYRTGAGDDPLDEWTSSNDDRTSTWSIGFRSNLIPKKLDWDASWIESSGAGQVINGYVPGGSASGDALLNFPAFSNEMQRLDTVFKIFLVKGWEVQAGYVMEKYDEEDFKLDPMGTYMGPYDSSNGSNRSNFLAARVPDYDADIVYVLVGYRW